MSRKSYMYNGQKIYEWEQTLEEIIIYITPPSGVGAKDLNIQIAAKKLKVGVKGNPLFLDDELGGICVVDKSLWMWEDGVISITLHKSLVGETWMSAFKGHTEMDPFALAQDREKLMKERFQRENPGFDFSSAKFTGDAPDPRTYMGGVNSAKLK